METEKKHHQQQDDFNACSIRSELYIVFIALSSHPNVNPSSIRYKAITRFNLLTLILVLFKVEIEE